VQVPVWQYPVADERPKFGQLVIPTLDSVRYEHLMTLVHSVGKARIFFAQKIDRADLAGHAPLAVPQLCAHRRTSPEVFGCYWSLSLAHS